MRAASLLGTPAGRLWLGLFWALALVFSPRLASAQAPPAVPPEIPPELRPWVPWALAELPQRNCAKSGDEILCFWPSSLELDVRPRSGNFELVVVLDSDGDVTLPGSAEHWPENVAVNGQPGTVLDAEGVPHVRLLKGRYRVQGLFEWPQGAPESLDVPSEVASVLLRVGDKVVPFPRREDSGAVWLGAVTEDATDAEPARAESDSLTLDVFRRLDDGLPLRVTTRLELRVSGRPREAAFARLLPEGVVPLGATSELATRLEADGSLRVQLRSGTHRVEIAGIAPKPLPALVAPKLPQPWPEQEVWVWSSSPELREVELDGASIDPERTSLAEDWRSLPAYVLAPGGQLGFRETRRGVSEPPPNRIELERELWLDLDGAGYSVLDSLSGEVHRDFRLNLLQGELDRVLVRSNDQLITVRAGKRGVELRDRALRMRAESRLEGRSDLPAVGWSEDVERLSFVLHLPPGFRLFGAIGPDRAPGAWLDGWDPVELVLIVLLALGLARLAGPGWGALLALFLVLCHTEPDAPRYTWIPVLIAWGLLRLKFRGWPRTVLRFTKVGFALLLAGFAIAFIASETRDALFPQHDDEQAYEEQEAEVADNKEGGTGTRAKGEEGSMGSQSVPTTSEPSPAAPAEDALGGLGVIGRGSGAGKGAPSGAPPVPEQAKPAEPLTTLQDRAVLQTGRGMPNWSFRRQHLEWTRPVVKGERVRLYLISPLVERMLTAARLLLLVLLVLLVGRSMPRHFQGGPDSGRPSKPRPPPERPPVPPEPADVNPDTPRSDRGSPPPAPPSVAFHDLRQPPFWRTARRRWARVFAVCFGALLLAPRAARAEVPSAELLEKLKQKLAPPAPCEPNCLSVSVLRVEANGRRLRLSAEVHAGSITAYTLPGPASAWTFDQLRVDGQPNAAVARGDDGVLRVRLAPGRHEVVAEGPIPGSELTLALGVAPRRIVARAEGWLIDGIRDDGQSDGTLTFTRTAEDVAVGPDTAGLEPAALPAWFEITRRFEIGVAWKVKSRLTRLSPPGASAVVRYPLLPGEVVTSAGSEVQGRELVLTVGRDAQTLEWESRLEPRELLRLVAPSGRWSETWVFAQSPIWTLDPQGLPPSRIENAEGAVEPLFQPWPGESLQVTFARPSAGPGVTFTIDSAHYTLKPSLTRLDASLLLRIRTSTGGVQKIRLPEGAKLRELSVNGSTRPARVQRGELNLSLTSGDWTVALSWQEARRFLPLFRAPDVDVGRPVANVRTRIELDPGQWVLGAGGASWGPAVGAYARILLLLALAWILGRIPSSPLRAWQWALLLGGMWRAPLGVALIVAASLWLYRAAERSSERPKYQRITIWIGTSFALALGAVLVLIVAYEHVALAPDMDVAGAGSSDRTLEFYEAHSGSRMGGVWVASAPLLVYRVLGAGWLLWILLGARKAWKAGGDRLLREVRGAGT